MAHLFGRILQYSIVSGWQYTCKAFNLDDGTSSVKNPVQIRICVKYFCQENTVYFDGIQLIKDVAQSYTYDSDGNLVSVSDNASQNSSMEYSNSNLISQTDINGNKYTYDYDDQDNMTKATSQNGLEYTYNYNSMSLPNIMV